MVTIDSVDRNLVVGLNFCRQTYAVRESQFWLRFRSVCISALVAWMLGFTHLATARAQSIEGYSQISHNRVVDSETILMYSSAASPETVLHHLEITFKIMNRAKADKLLKQMRDPLSQRYARATEVDHADPARSI